MGTTLLRHLVAFALLVVATPAFADSVVDQQDLEGRSVCAEGRCFEQQSRFARPAFTAVEGLGGLVQQAYVFAPDGRDPRVEFPATGFFAPIGPFTARVEKKKRESDTGELVLKEGTYFWISPCHFITADHVTTPVDKGDPEKSKYKIQFGPNPETDQCMAREVRKVSRTDLKIMRASKCIGSKVGWFALSSEKPNITRASIAGYYEDHNDNKLRGQRDCQVENKGREWHHYCGANHRTSGAPLFYFDPATGAPTVFAVSTEGLKSGRNHAELVRDKDHGLFNFAVDISSVYREIRGYIVQEITTAGGDEANPLIRKASTRAVDRTP